MISESYELFADKDNKGKRLDAYVYSQLQDVFFSRASVQKTISEGGISVNGQVITKSGYKICENDVVVCQYEFEGEIIAKPENIPIDIVYEDDDIIVVNKPRGMVVHPGAGNLSGTLANALMYHCENLSDINGPVRPGIVHRIDKDTTGLIVAAKNNKAHVHLAKQLEEHTMSRTYFAVVEGIVESNKGIIDAPIGRKPNDRIKMAVNINNGKEAVTHYEVLARSNGFSYVKCNLETGRTHQIRVHMAFIKHPVVGDPLYGIKDTRQMKGQALHAGALRLKAPADDRDMVFEASLPDDFYDLLKRTHLV